MLSRVFRVCLDLGSNSWRLTRLNRRRFSEAKFSDKDILGEFDASFNYNRTLYWHPSDQPKALERLVSKIDYIDAVVEVRDARIPLSSINPRLSEALGAKPRLVVYNKVDLASQSFDWDRFCGEIKKYASDEIVCTQAITSHNINNILDWAKKTALKYPHLYPYMCLVVIGPPNVGKSTLINKLRERGVRGRSTLEVGPNAGVTRTVQTRIRVSLDPPIYLVDTPGIFEPHLSHPINALKLALTGALKDTRIEPIDAADYLLYRMNATSHSKHIYTSYLGLNTHIEKLSQLLEILAEKYNINSGERTIRTSRLEGIAENEDLEYALDFKDRKLISRRNPDSKYNFDQAALKLIHMFRAGVLGQFTFDDCSPNIISNIYSYGGPAATLTARRFSGPKSKKSRKRPRSKPPQRKKI